MLLLVKSPTSLSRRTTNTNAFDSNGKPGVSDHDELQIIATTTNNGNSNLAAQTVAISGYQSLSQSFKGTFFELVMVENSRIEILPAPKDFSVLSLLAYSAH